MFRVGAGLLGIARRGAVIKSLCWPPLFKGENPLGSEANLVRAREIARVLVRLGGRIPVSEVLGNHRRQSQESRLALRLYLKYGSSTDHEGRQFWVVAAEREDSGTFIGRADES